MLSQIANLIAVASPAPAAGNLQLGKILPVTDAYSKGSEATSGAGAILNLELLISNMIGLITVVGAMFFLVEFFIGGFNWVSSGGDKGKVETARNKMTNGAIGMIIMVASYAIIGLVGSIIGLDILNPGAEIMKLVPGLGGGTQTVGPTPIPRI